MKDLKIGDWVYDPDYVSFGVASIIDIYGNMVKIQYWDEQEIRSWHVNNLLKV